MLLEKNERFVKEYREFSKKISLITNESVKSDLLNLLTQLLSEVRAIDKRHQDILSGIKLPSDFNDSRQTIINLRKKIHYRLEECEKSGLIKL